MGKEPLTDNRYTGIFIMWGAYEGVLTTSAGKIGRLLTMAEQDVNKK